MTRFAVLFVRRSLSLAGFFSFHAGVNVGADFQDLTTFPRASVTCNFCWFILLVML